MPALSNNPIVRPMTLLLVAAGCLGFGVGCIENQPAANLEAAASKPRTVYALGRIEPAGGVISISGTPGDRLMWLDADVQVNELAPLHGILGKLASFNLRNAQLQALRTKRELAMQQREIEILLADAKLKSARSAIAQAEAKQQEAELQTEKLIHLEESAAIASEDYHRLVELAQTDPELATPHELRRQQNLSEQATAEVFVATESQKALANAAQATVDAAAANLAAAEANRQKLDEVNAVQGVDQEIKVAEQLLAQSLLLAPYVDPSAIDMTSLGGNEDVAASSQLTVLEIFVNQGEMISQFPILQLGYLNQLDCIAEVYEADIQHVREGQKVLVTSPSFGETLEAGVAGKVVSIAGVVSSPGVPSRNPLAPVDRSVVKVNITLQPTDEAARRQLAKRIGLQVSVQFEE